MLQEDMTYTPCRTRPRTVTDEHLAVMRAFPRGSEYPNGYSDDAILLYKVANLPGWDASKLPVRLLVNG